MHPSTSVIFGHFRHNRWALTGAIFLGLVALVAIMGPLVSPETYQRYNYHRGGTHPFEGWRYLLGADVFGHSVLMYVILGARTTLGIATGATTLAMALGLAGAHVALRLGAFGRSALGVLAEIDMTIPMFPLVAALFVLVGGNSPWRMMLIFGLVAAPLVTKVVAGRQIYATGLGAGGRAVLPRDGDANLSDALTASVRTATTLLVSFAALEATIDYFGIGLPPADISWGLALQNWIYYLDAGMWWWLLFPGFTMSATLFAIVITGKGLATAIEASRVQPAPTPNGGNDSRP